MRTRSLSPSPRPAARPELRRAKSTGDLPRPADRMEARPDHARVLGGPPARAQPTPTEAATTIQRAYRQHLTKDIPVETKKHVHWGGTRDNPYNGLREWDTGGLHSWSSLQARSARDGISIESAHSHPGTGVIKAVVKNPDTRIDKPQKKGPPKTVVHNGGRKGRKEDYTLYPADVSPGKADAAAAIAFRRAQRGTAGTELTPPNEHQALGRFRAQVRLTDRPDPMTIEGYFDGAGKITSHYPVYPKD